MPKGRSPGRCPSGKRRYRTRVDALIALASTDLKGKKNTSQAQRRTETRAYRCPSCHGWHLTSMHRS